MGLEITGPVGILRSVQREGVGLEAVCLDHVHAVGGVGLGPMCAQVGAERVGSRGQ